jgi:hypothetical protein
MPRAGRPREDEAREIRARIEANRKITQDKVREFFVTSKRRLTASDHALVAARVLFTLERGTKYQKTRCQRLVKELLQFAHYNGPRGRWQSHNAFLKDFIRTHAPGWDWRKGAGTVAARDERYIRELAQDLRSSRAHRNRHILPVAPDPAWLIFLANRIKRNEPMTWTTLKEMKLAMGLSERTIRQTIKSSRPKKSELVLKTPKRFGPRLVLGVIEEFLNRLPDLDIGERQRSNCIAAAQQLRQRLIVSA